MSEWALVIPQAYLTWAMMAMPAYLRNACLPACLPGAHLHQRASRSLKHRAPPPSASGPLPTQLPSPPPASTLTHFHGMGPFRMVNAAR